VVFRSTGLGLGIAPPPLLVRLTHPIAGREGAKSINHDSHKIPNFDQHLSHLSQPAPPLATELGVTTRILDIPRASSPELKAFFLTLDCTPAIIFIFALSLQGTEREELRKETSPKTILHEEQRKSYHMI
jgi:hypothetical protein